MLSAACMLRSHDHRLRYINQVCKLVICIGLLATQAADNAVPHDHLQLCVLLCAHASDASLFALQS